MIGVISNSSRIHVSSRDVLWASGMLDNATRAERQQTYRMGICKRYMYMCTPSTDVYKLLGKLGQAVNKMAA